MMPYLNGFGSHEGTLTNAAGPATIKGIPRNGLFNKMKYAAKGEPVRLGYIKAMQIGFFRRTSGRSDFLFSNTTLLRYAGWPSAAHKVIRGL